MAYFSTGQQLFMEANPMAQMVKILPAMQKILGSITGSGRSLGKGNGYPLQYSCLGNAMDREPWQGTVHEITKSQTCLSN